MSRRVAAARKPPQHGRAPLSRSLAALILLLPVCPVLCLDARLAAADACCAPGEPCVLALTGGSPPDAEGAAVACVRTFIEKVGIEEIAMADGPPERARQRFLAVDVRVEDPTWAAHTDVCQAATRIVDARGQGVSTVFSVPSMKGEPPARDADNRPLPSIKRFHILFDIPRSDAVKPLYVDLRLDRFGESSATLEWRAVGPAPQFPLAAEGGGVSLTLETMEISNEPPKRGLPAQPHLVVRGTAKYIQPEPCCPRPSIGPFRLVAGADRTYVAGSLDARLSATPLAGGEMREYTASLCYHFPDLASIPPFSDIVVGVSHSYRLGEPSVHPLPSP